MEFRTLGHYRIIRELGHGGMGTVFLAVDERLKREIAIKVLSDRLTGFSNSNFSVAILTV